MNEIEVCFRCKQPVCLSGWNTEVDGFYENVAPNAASGGTMMPMHWKCSGFPFSPMNQIKWLRQS